MATEEIKSKNIIAENCKKYLELKCMPKSITFSYYYAPNMLPVSIIGIHLIKIISEVSKNKLASKDIDSRDILINERSAST